MDDLFQGDRELFKGLWIDSSDYDFKKHPVIHLNMNYAETSPSEILKMNIVADLREIAENEDISINVPDQLYDRILKMLVIKLFRKYESKAIILVDEYDAPITRNIDNPEVAKDNSEALHNFYSTFKNIDKYLRFVFVTGITPFALTAMDSGPNQFTDISLEPKFAGICGFTIEDFVHLFKERMDETLTELKNNGRMPTDSSIADLYEKIKDWYDGYNWGGKTQVLNPFSILNFFFHYSFDTYWLQSGRPSHLLALVRENPMDFLDPKLDSYKSAQLRKADLNFMSATPVLFHSGYLTIREVVVSTKKSDEDIYQFKLPNLEVEKSYRETLLEPMFGETLLNRIVKDLHLALLSQDTDNIKKIFEGIFSTVANKQHMPYERYYHSLIHVALFVAGFKIRSESSGSEGDSDLVAEFKIQILVIEVKYRKVLESHTESNREKELTAGIKDALECIDKKDYLGPFRLEGKEIKGLAIAVYGRNSVRAEYMQDMKLDS
jgi:hypothetical protein